MMPTLARNPSVSMRSAICRLTVCHKRRRGSPEGWRFPTNSLRLTPVSDPLVNSPAVPVARFVLQSNLRGLTLLLLLAVAVLLAALLIGSSGISVAQALAVLGGGGDQAARTVLLAVRLPRVLAGFGVG